MSLENYLSAMFGLKVELAAHAVKGPLYLRRFRVGAATILGRSILFAFVTRDVMSPSEYAQYARQLALKVGLQVVFVFGSITGSRRNAFIRNRVGFVVPGNQFFLPPLMDIKEWSPRTREPGEKFSYAAQVVVVRQLVSGDVEGMPLAGLARKLGYSSMTMTNAASELATANVVEIVGGRPKTLRFVVRGDDLWAATIHRMRSPVRRTVWNCLMPIGLATAGLSALSERTMLAPPTLKTFAAAVADAARRDIFMAAESKDDAVSELQIWHYQPKVTGGKGVDKYSLYLSLREMSDPRVEGELENLMEDSKC